MSNPALLALWATLAISLIVFVTTIIVLILVGLPAFQAVGEGSQRTNAALEELADKGEKLNESLLELTERQAELERHLGRLGISLERLSVLTWAIADAKTALRDVRALIPRK